MRLLASRPRILLLVLSASSACGSGAPEPEDRHPLFPLELRESAYVEVRPCRAPGEHSAIGAFTVWVDPDTAEAFDRLWSDPPEAGAMPEGAVVVKEVYRATDCAASEIDHWVAMKKQAGFDPDHGDWRWQDVTASGEVVLDGPEPACSGCHAGDASSTCAGYGALNGRDYLCTEP